jgi:hypothetical protein
MPSSDSPRRCPAEPFRLTHLQAYVLVKCYHDGYTCATVARWLGKKRSAIAQAIRLACDKLIRQGLPRPRPYGRGSRRQLRAVLPSVC